MGNHFVEYHLLLGGMGFEVFVMGTRGDVMSMTWEREDDQTRRDGSYST